MSPTSRRSADATSPTRTDARYVDPSLIVEVLSDATDAYDRDGKFALYRQLPSLREYLLISQHQVQVDLYTRGEDDRWILTDFSALTDSVYLPSVDCTLALAEVYDKVDILTA